MAAMPGRHSIKWGDKLSIVELEEALGITDKDTVECPFVGDNGCEDCKQGLDIETCEELYKEWLLEQVSIL